MVPAPRTPPQVTPDPITISHDMPADAKIPCESSLATAITTPNVAMEFRHVPLPPPRSHDRRSFVRFARIGQRRGHWVRPSHGPACCEQCSAEHSAGRSAERSDIVGHTRLICNSAVPEPEIKRRKDPPARFQGL